MQYIDMEEFEEFMRERNLVPEKYHSFYAHWVRRFLQSEFNARELAANDKVACYLDQLARDDAVKDWQLQQAEQAVKLYLDVFLPEADRARPLASDSVSKKMGADARQAVADMRKLLRMRHYAYRTEQTYLEWIERFMQYAQRQGLDWKETGSVRSYLSHLALSKKVASPTQNQALNALVFLFREVRGKDLGWTQL